MFGNFSITGFVLAAVLMIPTALFAQIGGAVKPAVHVGGAVSPGATVRGGVDRGIPGPDLGTWRSPSRGRGKRSHYTHKTTPKQRR
jgi:hypothetical protein